MRTIIAGGRNFSQMALMADSLHRLPWAPSVVLSGTTEGADRLGELWAERMGVPVERHPADWATHGKYVAGFMRNKKMASLADALVAFWDGKSSGTAHMIKTMTDLDKRVFVVDFKPVVFQPPTQWRQGHD